MRDLTPEHAAARFAADPAFGAHVIAVAARTGLNRLVVARVLDAADDPAVVAAAADMSGGDRA